MPQLLIIYSSAEVVEGKTPLVRGQVHGNVCPFMRRLKRLAILYLTVPEPSCSSLG